MRAEFNAFKTCLAAHTILSGKVDTVVRLNTDGSPVRTNYVIATPSVPDRLDDGRFTAPQQADSDRLLTFDVRTVAVDSDGVLLLTEAVITQVVGHELTVPGRRCERIRLVEGVEEGRVEFDRTARLFYVDMSFRFVSRRG